MPRPPMTPARRVAMQAVMWVALAASVGVAALIDGGESLGQIARFGPISLRLPEGWEVAVPDEATPPRRGEVVIDARDPEGERLLHLYSDRFDTPGAAAQSLSLTGSVPVSDFQSNGLTWKLERVPAPSDGQRFRGWVAITATPGGRVIGVLLGTAGLPDAADRKLLELVARSVRVGGR